MTPKFESQIDKVPITVRGLQRIWHAIKFQEAIHKSYPLEDEPVWNLDHVAFRPNGVDYSLDSFGYGDQPIGAAGDKIVCGPFQILTDEAVAKLGFIARRLEDYATFNEYVVKKRLRNVEKYSMFVRNMVRDRGFVSALSQLAGVPLTPHPLSSAGVQLNYYEARGERQNTPENDMAKWHTDGTDFVFTMLLSHRDDYEGGNFIFFKGVKDEFESLGGQINQHFVETAGFANMGDILFTRGSRLYHAVTPVTAGSRITITISMFCPKLAKHDSNTFWHVAGDDGVYKAIGEWLRFKQYAWNPDALYRYYGLPNTLEKSHYSNKT